MAMTVYLSSALNNRYPHIFSLIKGMVESHGYEFEELETSNIWVRDFMPIKTNGSYTKFGYSGYLPSTDGKSYPQLSFSSDIWRPFCDVESPLVLDGGNVEMNDQTVIFSDILLKHNQKYDYHKMVSALEEVFDREVMFLPVEPYDDLGHIDGIARFVDEKTVLVNEYPSSMGFEYEEYQNRVRDRLKLNGFNIVPLVNAYDKMPKMTEKQFRVKYPDGDSWNPGFGYFINFLKVGNLLFIPTFNIKEDNEAYKVFSSCFPECEIIPVVCSEVSLEGGLVHCISWTHE